MNQPNAHPSIVPSLGTLLIGLSLMVLPATAQEYAGCFWIDDRGKRIDLSEFCPSPLGSTPEGEAAGSAPLSPSDANASGGVSVPIVRRDAGVPVVSVLFNGQPYEMLLDTGASVIVLPRRIARELGLQATGSMLVTTASADRVEFGVTQIESVQLGSLVMNDLDAAIGNDDSLDIGLLGQNFFSRYDLTIRQDTVELTPRLNP